MSADVVLRAALPAEADLLTALALRSKAYWGYSAAFIDGCREELQIDPEQIASQAVDYVVAERGSQLLGFYGLCRGTPEEFELEALFVEPAHIGTGIGRRLVQHALGTARRRGGRFVAVQGDPNAEGFYRAAGGKPAGCRESSSIPGRYLPVFRIPLAGKLTM